MNRLTNVVWKTNGGTIASFYYQLGLSGNRTNLSESVNGTSRTYGWTYDSLYQLKQETSELDTPTNARRVPTKNDLALGQLLTYERLSSEGKLGYSNSTPKRLA